MNATSAKLLEMEGSESELLVRFSLVTYLDIDKELKLFKTVINVMNKGLSPEKKSIVLQAT